jgi:hypothetical protein
VDVWLSPVCPYCCVSAEEHSLGSMKSFLFINTTYSGTVISPVWWRQSYWNTGNPFHLGTSDCPRRLLWISKMLLLYTLQITTHQEVTDTSFLSNLACLIPLPDCNQSPRNMYQCQVRKFRYKYLWQYNRSGRYLKIKGWWNQKVIIKLEGRKLQRRTWFVFITWCYRCD